jgi:peptidyl-tRNA hydrolase, PTH1 family
MGILQRQPINLSQKLPYTVSFGSRTVLIVGLGNPGTKYALTRHNCGFMALDAFAKTNQFEPWQNSQKFKGAIAEKDMGQTRVILLKPSTYMNLSGEAVSALASFYKIGLDDILAVYDELSIPFGHIRVRKGGQSAGHKGVKSLIEHPGSEFYRLRIGTKNQASGSQDSADFVLAKFTATEQKVLPTILKETNSIITEFIYGGSLAEQTRKIDVGR